MQIHYISPSVLPSRNANAVHVLKQCDALARHCEEVFCYARRSVLSSDLAEEKIRGEYGLLSPNLTFRTHFFPSNRAVSFLIAMHSFLRILATSEARVLSRNLYASFLWGVIFSRELLFETHQLETGVRKWMQHLLIKRSNVTTIVISRKLEEILQEYHQTSIKNSVVLHDAAEADSQRYDKVLKTVVLKEYGINNGSWRSVCGYFGHLYPGRGMEIIVAMAEHSPDDLFIVVGGTKTDIERLRAKHLEVRNLKILGFMPHSEAQRLMKAVDVLLMPYQRSVSIGVQGHDTARWMSPMKMFEYMACGVPLISSDLDVLKEVLTDGVNALLVSPEDSSKWCAALEWIMSNKSLAYSIGEKAYRDYSDLYTWDKRADHIIAEFR